MELRRVEWGREAAAAPEGQDHDRPEEAAEIGSETYRDSPPGRYARPATDTPAFHQWFGDSKVVDAEGKPLAIPPLELSTDEARARFLKAIRRKAARRALSEAEA